MNLEPFLRRSPNWTPFHPHLSLPYIPTFILFLSPSVSSGGSVFYCSRIILHKFHLCLFFLVIFSGIFRSLNPFTNLYSSFSLINCYYLKSVMTDLSLPTVIDLVLVSFFPTKPYFPSSLFLYLHILKSGQFKFFSCFEHPSLQFQTFVSKPLVVGYMSSVSRVDWHVNCTHLKCHTFHWVISNSLLSI